MKKICIFTMFSNNYGAILQTYALQRFLRNKYVLYEVFLASFYESPLNRIFRRYHTNPIKNIIYLFIALLRYGGLKRRVDRIKLFVKQEFILTKKYESSKTLLENLPKANIYLTGSDQVFNPNSESLLVFFQSFKKVDAKKVAYAPSFGISEFSQSFKDSIRDYVLDFDSLSCREKSGSELLSSLLGKSIPTVLDPTFLLRKEEWKKVSISPNFHFKYIFIYDLNGAEYLVDIANKIKAITGYKIICQTQKIQKFYKHVDKQIYSSGPREFVGLIQNAEIIVTDSFHGTAFSLIFEKPFYTYIAIKHSSERIISLLRLLDLESRIVYNSKDFSYDHSLQEGNNYMYKLNNLIDESQKFLTDALE